MAATLKKYPKGVVIVTPGYGQAHTKFVSGPGRFEVIEGTPGAEYGIEFDRRTVVVSQEDYDKVKSGEVNSIDL